MSRALKVLLVEDQDQIREAYAETLRKDPLIEVIEARTLEEAAKAAFQERQFTVLVDLTLEDAKGVQAVRQLRQKQPGATIVVITAHGDEVDDACIEAGATTVIHKGEPNSYGVGLINALHRAVAERDAFLMHLPVLAKLEEGRKILRNFAESFK